MSTTFALLVPVKPLAHAKSRLATTEPRRRDLMRAFAQDALTAARGCAQVARVYVVGGTDLELGGATVLPDEGAGDLNAALRHAAVRLRQRDPRAAIAAMCADLPALTPEDLGEALSAGRSPRWFVADAAGTGTTMLVAAPGVDLDPHFGASSARRHEESGAVAVRAGVPTLRLDVDTESDLARARALGVGVYTAEVLRTAFPPL